VENLFTIGSTTRKKRCQACFKLRGSDRIPDPEQEKLRDLFHFAIQLLYSPVLETRTTTARGVNHTNAVNREWRKPIPQY
jgi:hypothetical protein